MPKSDKKEATYSETETEARREATLKQLLATPPKPRETKRSKGEESSQRK